MFEEKDLIWAKSVTRDKGNNWAYLDYLAGDFFYLNCSNVNRKNILKPKKGELILLFQSYKKVTYLTHLVTPVEDITEIDKTSSDFPVIRKMFVVSALKIVKPKHLDFKGPNRGKICPLRTIKDFTTKKEIELNLLQKNIFSLFKINSQYNKEFLDEILNYDLDDFEVVEGEVNEILRRHKFYERNKTIIQKVKEKAKKENKLFCSVCNFNFEKYYSELGNGFIECHHIYPIAKSGIRKTSEDDLVLVCSNCHRMLHRKQSNGEYPSIDRLKKIIDKNESIQSK